MQGVGTEELWKVNKGVSACCVAFGLVAVAQSAVGFFLFARHDPARSHFVVGIFVGSSLLVGVTMLGQAGLWMAQWNLVYRGGAEIFPLWPSPSPRTIHVAAAAPP